MSYPPPYERTTWHGKTVDQRSKYLLELVEAKLGYELTCFQGHYNAGGVAASAGTHDGGGAVDVWGKDPDQVVRVLREFGWAAWHRTPAQGPWGHYIHAVECGNDKLSSGAANQVAAYKAGRNGLASGGADDGPRITLRARPYPPLPVLSAANIRKQAENGGRRVTRGVRRVQRALSAEGYAVVVDGRFGPMTRRAFKAFEKDHGFDGDGLPAVPSLRRLGRGRFKVRK